MKAMLLERTSNPPTSPSCWPSKILQHWSNSSNNCRRLRPQLSRPRWTQACPPRVLLLPTASMIHLLRAMGTTKWPLQSQVLWLLSCHAPQLRVCLCCVWFFYSYFECYCLLQQTDYFCIALDIAQRLHHQVRLHPLYLWQVQLNFKQQPL